jgi:hypothetical protein
LRKLPEADDWLDADVLAVGLSVTSFEVLDDGPDTDHPDDAPEDATGAVPPRRVCFVRELQAPLRSEQSHDVDAGGVAAASRQGLIQRAPSGVTETLYVLA